MGEFVTLMALLSSLVALAIDAVLPALAAIREDLQVAEANNVQLVVSVFLLGLALGQFLAGPLSDWTGRKPMVGLGLGLFAIGCIVAMSAHDLRVLLLGRLIQGIGLAAPRVVSLALIRDLFSGEAMAKVMSFVMAIFILVPLIAPALGQALLFVASWRMLFGAFLLLATSMGIWFAIRQPETLARKDRRRPSPRQLGRATLEVLKTRASLGYSITAGLASGALIGYLSSAQQIFQEQYDLGALFPVVFGALAASIGLASLLNGRLVSRFGMRRMVLGALRGFTGLAFLYSLVVLALQGHPPLWSLMLFLASSFFAVGVLFGNLNALAMEPLGHIAGLGAAIVGSLGTLISTILGMVVGQFYDGTVTPLVTAFTVLGVLALITVRWTETATT
ncbi:MAG: multidrug effflux MFS transporter [Thermoanaerobaculia bacterium]|nr:multidrug effflux MFS transporter [Thermoanaerobaculia bacterium]